MKKKLTTKTIMFGLLMGGVTFTAEAGAPKYMVGIMVDQLRTDYLERFRPYFGDKGFNRLIADGVYLTDVDFRNTVSDAPSGTAVIFTGAWPSANGIAGAEVLDTQLKRNVPTLAVDPAKLKTDYSPEALKLSTIADEFYISNGNLSKIFSIAGDPQVAVVASGHAGSAAVWLDESSGKWTSPVYYGATPAVVANKNRTSPLSSKLASLGWKPLHDPSFYDGGNTWNEGNFSYSFAGGSRDTYNKLKASAPFSREVTDMAIDLLKTLQKGQPGMLNVAYSLAPYEFDYDGDNRPELTDAYLKLDEELGRLLDVVYNYLGKENTVIFLSSTGYASEPEIPELEARIPTGEITLKKAESLLNSYLSASYGNGDYVQLIKDGKLFFDQKEIEKKGLDIKKLRTEAKSFLLKMGGVAEVYTITEILNSEGRKAEEIALGIDAKHSPDLFLFFTPGWTVTDDNVYPAVSEKVRLAATPTPAFIAGPGIHHKIINKTVDATAIAPTISSALRIRAPNGAASKPISLLGE